MYKFESYENKDNFKSKNPAKQFRNDIHGILWRLARVNKEWFLNRQELGIAKILNDYLEPISKIVDGNIEPKYQEPLKLLYQAKKAGIEYKNGKFYCPRFSKKMIYIDGEWSWLNKLSTNVYSHVTLLADYFQFLFEYENDFKKVAYSLLEKTVDQFKDSVKHYVHLDRNLYGIDFAIYLGVAYPEPFDLVKYVGVIKDNTAKGDKYEDKAIDFVKTRGWRVLYQGSNGDLIDILLGIDLIIEKQNTVKTVQVKSYSIDYIDKDRYSEVDVFIGFSDTGSIEFLENRK